MVARSSLSDRRSPGFFSVFCPILIMPKSRWSLLVLLFLSLLNQSFGNCSKGCCSSSSNISSSFLAWSRFMVFSPSLTVVFFFVCFFLAGPASSSFVHFSSILTRICRGHQAFGSVFWRSQLHLLFLERGVFQTVNLETYLLSVNSLQLCHFSSILIYCFWESRRCQSALVPPDGISRSCRVICWLP